MNAHDRTVDHLHLAVVRLHDRIHQAIPDAGSSPAVEAVVDGRVGPVAFGQIAPWRAGSQNPEDAVDHLAVILRLHAAPLRRQERLDDAPLGIGQVVPA